MAIVVAVVGEGAQAQAAWEALVERLGDPVSAGRAGPARAAVFAQHAGERADVPGESANGPVEGSGFRIGFGGDGRGTPVESLPPPWMCVRWDAGRGRLVVETDRHGFALGYVRRVGDAVAFCTSAARLGRLHPALPRDEVAVAELVAFDHLLGTRTLRRGVAAIPYGHRLEIEASGYRCKRTFSYSDVARVEADTAKSASELVERWRDAVARALRTRGDEAALVPLSGGLDSRLLASTATDQGAPIEAFTFAWRDANGGEAPDVVIARRVARALGVPWRFVPLEDDWLVDHGRRAASLTDGQLDLLHSYGVSLLDAMPEGRLRLDGLAGDVVVGGSFLAPALWSTRGKTGREEALWRARSRIRGAAWQAILGPGRARELADMARASMVESLGDVGGDDRWSDFWILAHRIRRFTVNGALLWQGCTRSVFPYFSPGFVDRLLSLPPRSRHDSRLQAPFFHGAAPAMAGIPWQKTGRPLARYPLIGKILSRLRQPDLVPGGRFFDFDVAAGRSPRLVAFLREHLLDPGAGVGRFGYFDVAAVERSIRAVERREAKGMTQLGLLLTLVLSEEVWSVRSS